MFFFSSRRRHTRLTCDWSSDVCSSDLVKSQMEVGAGNESGDHAGTRERPDVGVGDVVQMVGGGCVKLDSQRSEERRVGKECRAGRGWWQGREKVCRRERSMSK